MSVQPIIIKSLRDFVGDSELDNALCPVRCLHRYIVRTSDPHILKGRVKLFIPHSATSVAELSAAALSSYIKSAVVTAYQNVQPELHEQFKVNAHQIRLLSASIAKASNVSLDIILRSGQWQSSSTFTDFYLRSLAVHSDSLFSLGPIAVAQTKVLPGRLPLD